MKNKTGLLKILCVISWVIGFVAFYFIPEGSFIPIRYNLLGEITQTSNSPFALFLMPFVLLLLIILKWSLTYIEPRSQNLKYSEKALVNTITAVSFFMITLQLLMMAQTFTELALPISWIYAMIGVIFVFIGNFLPKTQSNYFFGIRTPWTLADDEIWRKTHRFSGPIFMLSGAIIVLLSLINLPYTNNLLLVVITATVIISTGYSLMLWLIRTSTKKIN